MDTGGTSRIDLSIEELREVARFAVRNAEVALSVFEQAEPGDPRPREAIDAAWAFARGAPRSRLQRSTATAAHRAARETGSEAARHAASAAGDAAAAAYLHPLAKATQVGHILRSAVHAALAVELDGGVPDAAADVIEQAAARATPVVVTVLQRYPAAPDGTGQVAGLTKRLDDLLRST